MQQSDLWLTIWVSANIPIQLLWFHNGDHSWNIYSLLKIPSKEQSNSCPIPLLYVWSQKFVKIGLANITDHNMYKFAWFYLTSIFYIKNKLTPLVAGSLAALLSREGLAPPLFSHFHPHTFLPLLYIDEQIIMFSALWMLTWKMSNIHLQSGVVMSSLRTACLANRFQKLILFAYNKFPCAAILKKISLLNLYLQQYLLK